MGHLGRHDMYYMFYYASAFDQDIGGCGDTRSRRCPTVLQHASSFDQDIGAWDTSGVTSMDSMFYYASAFNQDIGAWDTSGVTSMTQRVQLRLGLRPGHRGTPPVTTMYHDVQLGLGLRPGPRLVRGRRREPGRRVRRHPCESTSCGVTQVDDGRKLPRHRRRRRPLADDARSDGGADRAFDDTTIRVGTRGVTAVGRDGRRGDVRPSTTHRRGTPAG